MDLALILQGNFIILIYRLIFVGRMNSYPYISKVKADYLQYDKYVSLVDYKMVTNNAFEFNQVALPSLMNDNISFSSPSLFSKNIITLSLKNSFDTDISLNWDPITSKIVIPSLEPKVLLDLSWSISGLEDITYQLSANTGLIVPNWVSLDLANSALVVNTTNVSVGTSTSFTIKSTNANYLIWDKAINLEIVSWTVENWLICQSNNPNFWKTCSDGYSLSSDSTSCPVDSLNTISRLATSANQAIIGAVAVAGASALFSFWNISSPQGMRETPNWNYNFNIFT